METQTSRCRGRRTCLLPSTKEFQTVQYIPLEIARTQTLSFDNIDPFIRQVYHKIQRKSIAFNPGMLLHCL